MKEFIHSLTGTRMLVDDDREAEYLAAGHRLAKADKAAKSDRQEASTHPKEEKTSAVPVTSAQKAAPARQKNAAKK